MDYLCEITDYQPEINGWDFKSTYCQQIEKGNYYVAIENVYN